MPARRPLLRGGAVGAVAFLAGCLGDIEDESDWDSLLEDGDESERDRDVDDGTDSAGARDVDEDEGTEPTGEDPDAPLVTVDGREAVTIGQVESVSEPAYDPQLGDHVSVQLSESGTESLIDALEAAGALEDPRDAEVRTRAGEGSVETFTLGPALAEEMKTGEFDGEFVLTFESEEEATDFYLRVTESR